MRGAVRCCRYCYAFVPDWIVGKTPLGVFVSFMHLGSERANTMRDTPAAPFLGLNLPFFSMMPFAVCVFRAVKQGVESASADVAKEFIAFQVEQPPTNRPIK